MKLEIIQEKVRLSELRLVRVTKKSGILLIGCIAFGIIDRGTFI